MLRVGHDFTFTRSCINLIRIILYLFLKEVGEYCFDEDWLGNVIVNLFVIRKLLANLLLFFSERNQVYKTWLLLGALSPQWFFEQHTGYFGLNLMSKSSWHRWF
jgi:hypothetical protein